MASNIYTQAGVDGTKRLVRRVTKQGRPPAGLGDAYLQRLDAETETKLLEIAERLGTYYNKNEIVRAAAKIHVDLIYTELVKS